MHFQVPYLEIPEAWSIGGITLNPSGWLLDAIGRSPLDIPDALMSPLREHPWTTVAVPVDRPGDADAIDVARNRARDALAVLDLYRHARLPFAPMDRQSFGMAVDVYTASEHRWITDASGAFAQTSAGRYGTLGPWTFTQADIGAFRGDPRFAYLDDALCASLPNDLQARIVTAIRTLALSRLVARAALRIALLASTIESLVGDPYREGAAATGAHQLARRAAFLWCGSGSTVPRHGPERVACSYLTAMTAKALGQALSEREARGEPTYCSAYADLRSLSRDRGTALHGARLDFPGDDVRHHEWVVRGVVLEMLQWVATTRAEHLSQFEAEIQAVPSSEVAFVAPTSHRPARPG